MGLPVAIFCPDVRRLDPVLAELPERDSARTTSQWSLFKRHLSHRDFALVVLSSRSEAIRTHISELNLAFPDRPVLLVTDKDLRLPFRLLDVRIHEIVWTGELRNLPAAIARAKAAGLFRALETEIARATHLSTTLREALELVVHSDHPFRSVNSLCLAVGRDRRTLSAHWRRAAGARVDGSLKRCLSWVLLLRAVSRKTETVTWETTARELRISEQTLRKTAQALTGRSLRQVTSKDIADLLWSFRARIFDPLLDGADSKRIGKRLPYAQASRISSRAT